MIMWKNQTFKVSIDETFNGYGSNVPTVHSSDQKVSDRIKAEDVSDT